MLKNPRKKKSRHFSLRRGPCLLVALVCDIRGFTDLTARIDELSLSRFVPSKNTDRLLKQYEAYVHKTQDLAEEFILSNLKPKHPHVLKSTGDGFLLALRLSGVNGWPKNQYPAEWRTAISQMANGLSTLVNAADPTTSSPAQFGQETARFIDKWGRMIGLTSNELKGDKSLLRVAGAIAAGTGFITDKDPEGKKHPDAYGNTVNLAFRLCDKAGRLDAAGNVSPNKLLDRRVARLLLDGDGAGWEARIEPCKGRTSLKGIEENWSYCFDLTPRS